ncbi:MAG: Fe-S cluster assembly protein SufD [Gammaproteobacteria bacterium]|nr:Fe-S cluster assembly protein SufD [Gammaproteobacteria bacterium]
MGNVSRYLDNYQDLATTLPGQDLPWLQSLRKTALQQFAASGFPSPREEDWRYTNVTAIEKKLFAPMLGFVSTNPNLQFIDKECLQSQLLSDAWTVVLVDGHFSAELSALNGLPDNILVSGMATALESKPEWVQPYLGQALPAESHGFIAFNTAWFSDGVFIHIPTKQVLAKPIQILNVVTQAEVSATTRNLIVADCSTEATVIESFAATTGETYLTASVTEIFTGENAHITLHKLQCEADKAYHFGGTHVKQGMASRFSHHNFAFGGLLARTDVHVDMDKASECELNGLYLGVNRQHLDNHTRINHLQPHGISKELYKGVLDDRARGVFQGRVIVAENAQKTDSQMSNRNLLLSNDAEADTKPQLEIYADDVKCGHGVTVGQLDEKSVFYLQSRCVDEETARNMLTFAFANEMVEKIKIKSLHDKVLEQVLKRFPQEGVEKEWL